MIEQWECRKCHEVYPFSHEYFSIDPHGKEGLHTSCKGCESKRERERYWQRRNQMGNQQLPFSAADEAQQYIEETEFQTETLNTYSAIFTRHTDYVKKCTNEDFFKSIFKTTSRPEQHTIFMRNLAEALASIVNEYPEPIRIGFSLKHVEQLGFTVYQMVNSPTKRSSSAILYMLCVLESEKRFLELVDIPQETRNMCLDLVGALYPDLLSVYKYSTAADAELRRHLLTKMSYREYLTTPEWLETRERKLKQANSRCELCSTSYQLQVHHKTYVRLGKEWDSDLIVLCDNCHAKFHDKLAKELQ